MNDSYVECLVAQRPSSLIKFLKIFSIMLAVAFLLLYAAIGPVALILAIVFGVLGYFATMNASVEYEYLYVDKEVMIDKVINKSKRKKVGSFEVERMEILAPINSYHLDNFKNRQFTQKDFSIGYEEKPDKRYVLIYDGTTKLMLSPSPEFVTAVKNVAPRKVFTD